MARFNPQEELAFDEIEYTTLSFKTRADLISVWRAVMKWRYFEQREGQPYTSTWVDRLRERGADNRFKMVEVNREGGHTEGLHDSLLKVRALNEQTVVLSMHIYYLNQEHPEYRTVLLQGPVLQNWVRDEFPVIKRIVHEIFREEGGASPEQIWQAAQRKTQPMLMP